MTLSLPHPFQFFSSSVSSFSKCLRAIFTAMFVYILVNKVTTSNDTSNCTMNLRTHLNCKLLMMNDLLRERENVWKAHKLETSKGYNGTLWDLWFVHFRNSNT